MSDLQQNKTEGVRYRVGPFVIDVEKLPEDWRKYANAYLHRASHDDAVSLRVSIGRVDDSAFARREVFVQMQEISRIGEAFVIDGGEAYRATYDAKENTLVIDVDALLHRPHIVLGNALRGAVSLALPLVFDGLMFHASSGIYDGCGLLFPGISTAGKTTLALGLEKGTYMSDDVSLTGGLSTTPRLDASPFFGAFGKKGANVSAPLAAVGVLVAKAERETSVVRVASKDAVQLLLRHAISWTRDGRVHAALLARVVDLVARVPVFAVERFIEDSSDAVCERVLAAVTRG